MIHPFGRNWRGGLIMLAIVLAVMLASGMIV